ncbi:MAG: GAF domain-containing protein [Chloroflexi bacterium]|nr:MAG: GAF domain-containing protein [Chloroflexota bacterium]
MMARNSDPCLQFLIRLGEVGADDLPLEEQLAVFARLSARLAGVDGCTVLRWNREADTVEVLADYVSPDVDSPFAGVDQRGSAYPLADYPLTARVLTESTPVVFGVTDAHIAQTERSLLEAFRWQDVLQIPIRVRQKTLGVVKFFLARGSSTQFTADLIGLASALAVQAGLLLENAGLVAEGEEGRLHAEALQVIGRALASELDYQRIVRNVAEFAYRLTGPQFVFVAVPDGEDKDSLRVVAAIGRNELDGSLVNIDDIPPPFLHQRGVQEAVSKARPVVIPDALAEMDRVDTGPLGLRWQSMAAAPLLAHNQLVGVLAAYAAQPHFFTASDVSTLMSLASQAAVAIQNARLFAELAEQREALWQMSLRLVHAQEEERRRISRELHDELGQALTALKINLDLARRAMPDDAPPRLVRSVQEAAALAVQTLNVARDMSLALHPAMLDDLGLVAALRWEIDRYEQRTGQSVSLEIDLDESAVGPELAITAYRIISEALTNAARHAQADTVAVSLTQTGRGLEIVVQDDGVGFDAARWLASPEERRSLGLLGMRERAVLLGGQVDIISSPGRGTRIEAFLPLQQKR